MQVTLLQDTQTAKIHFHLPSLRRQRPGIHKQAHRVNLAL